MDIMTFRGPEGSLLFGFLHADGAFHSVMKNPKAKQRAPRSGWGFPYILPSYFLIILWKSTGTPAGSSSFLPTHIQSKVSYLTLDTVLVFLWDKNFESGWESLSIMGNYSGCDKNVFCLWQNLQAFTRYMELARCMFLLRDETSEESKLPVSLHVGDFHVPSSHWLCIIHSPLGL